MCSSDLRISPAFAGDSDEEEDDQADEQAHRSQHHREDVSHDVYLTIGEPVMYRPATMAATTMTNHMNQIHACVGRLCRPIKSLPRS